MINKIFSTIRLAIIEDEELFRLKLEAFAIESGYQVVASTDNSEDAIKLIQQQKPDIVIMDININGEMNGIEVAEKLKNTPSIFLFITSLKDREKYEQAKQTASIGFLIKPFDLLTLQSTIEFSLLKKEQIEKKPNVTITEIIDKKRNSIFIKHNAQLYKIQLGDISYIEAKGKLSFVFTDSKKLISSTSLSKFLRGLPEKDFIQIHKSYILNSNYITKVISKNNEVYIGEKVFPIGRVYKEKFLKQFDIF